MAELGKTKPVAPEEVAPDSIDDVGLSNDDCSVRWGAEMLGDDEGKGCWPKDEVRGLDLAGLEAGVGFTGSKVGLSAGNGGLAVVWLKLKGPGGAEGFANPFVEAVVVVPFIPSVVEFGFTNMFCEIGRAHV